MAYEFREDAVDTPLKADTAPPSTDNLTEDPPKRRGRPPGSKSSTSTRRRTTNTDLANAAADVLMQTNSMVGVVAGFAGLPETQDAIVEKNPLFREQAYNALLADPDLCKSITAGGGVTGKVALVFAYAMFASYVLPTGANEWREKSAERRKRRELEIGE